MPLLKHVVEALVFASQKPLVPREIAGALKAAAEESEDAETKAFGKTREAEIGQVLEELKSGARRRRSSAFQLVEQVNGWHFVTRGAYAPWVRQLYPESKPIRLSGPALETLAIISYRQPITRADIEAVRGVAVDAMVNMLVDRQLVRIAGRSDAPGRPAAVRDDRAFPGAFRVEDARRIAERLRVAPHRAALRRHAARPCRARGSDPAGERAGGAERG